MLGLGLIPILAFGLLALMPTWDTASDGEEDATPPPPEPDPQEPVDPVDPMDPVDPVDPVDPATLGATFELDETGVTIEFGENEAGRLAVFTWVYETAFDGLLNHEARYYLVPEGVEWPENTSETQENVPRGPNGEYPNNMGDFEEIFELELLGITDLLADGNDRPTSRDMASALPTLTTNADTEYYYLNDNFSDIFSFLTEGWLETRNGVTETPVTDDTVGTDGSDWITTRTFGLTVDGADGDDVLEFLGERDLFDPEPLTTLMGGEGEDILRSEDEKAVLYGGADDDRLTTFGGAAYGDDGDDRIRTYSEDASVFGGAGNDDIDLFLADNAFADGGEGDDRIEALGVEGGTVYGGAGDDALIASIRGNEGLNLYGGDGNDFHGGGATGVTHHGEAGDDVMVLSGGSTLFGGDGDDTIRGVGELDLSNGTAEVTGGAGADVYEVSPVVRFDSVQNGPYLTILDFNPEEDVLVLPNFGESTTRESGVQGIRLNEDVGQGYTDVELVFDPRADGTERVAVVRLTGVTGFSADMVVRGAP